MCTKKAVSTFVTLWFKIPLTALSVLVAQVHDPERALLLWVTLAPGSLLLLNQSDLEQRPVLKTRRFTVFTNKFTSMNLPLIYQTENITNTATPQTFF